MTHLIETLRQERRALTGVLATAEDLLQNRVPARTLEHRIRDHYGESPKIPDEQPARRRAVEDIIRRADRRRRLVVRMLSKCTPNPFVSLTHNTDADGPV